MPLFPVFVFYFIAVLAETSRTPFDLQEAKPYKGLINRTIFHKLKPNLLYKNSSIKIIKSYYHTQIINNSIYDEKDSELVVLLIKKLSRLGLNLLNSHMTIGKNTLNSMILNLDPKDPIISFLRQKLIEIPFENCSKYGTSLININQWPPIFF